MCTQLGEIYRSSEAYEITISAEALKLCVWDNLSYDCRNEFGEIVRSAAVKVTNLKNKRP